MLPEPVDPDQPDNIWEPVHADLGAHGQFDAQARGFSVQLWASEHRALLGGLVVAAAGLIGGVAAMTSSRRAGVR